MNVNFNFSLDIDKSVLFWEQNQPLLIELLNNDPNMIELPKDILEDSALIPLIWNIQEKCANLLDATNKILPFLEQLKIMGLIQKFIVDSAYVETPTTIDWINMMFKMRNIEAVAQILATPQIMDNCKNYKNCRIDIDLHTEKNWEFEQMFCGKLPNETILRYKIPYGKFKELPNYYWEQLKMLDVKKKYHPDEWSFIIPHHWDWEYVSRAMQKIQLMFDELINTHTTPNSTTPLAIEIAPANLNNFATNPFGFTIKNGKIV